MQTYDEALAAGKKAGASKATDTQLTAMLLESTAQLALGAVSPRLMYEGAMRQDLTSKQVAEMMARDPRAAEDLMWGV